jgi:hypothetical protein
MSTSVSATASASSPNQAAVTNVSATVQGSQPNLVITPGTTSVSITGTLADPFSDSFTYVEQGKTNLNSTPTTVVGTDNMPSNKVFYDLNQDGRNYVSEFFDITVQWESGPSGNMTAQTPATFTLELKIYNEWEGIRSFVSNYQFPSC